MPSFFFLPSVGAVKGLLAGRNDFSGRVCAQRAPVTRTPTTKQWAGPLPLTRLCPRQRGDYRPLPIPSTNRHTLLPHSSPPPILHFSLSPRREQKSQGVCLTQEGQRCQRAGGCLMQGTPVLAGSTETCNPCKWPAWPWCYRTWVVSGRGSAHQQSGLPGLLKIALGSASLCLTPPLSNQSIRCPEGTRGSEASWPRIAGGTFGEEPPAW